MSGAGLVRLGGNCGPLFVVLMVPAYVVGYPDAPTSTTSAREVLGYFGASPGTFVFFNGTVALFSTFFFLWFLGVLYGVLRRVEGVDGVLSSIVLEGGILFITRSPTPRRSRGSSTKCPMHSAPSSRSPSRLGSITSARSGMR